MKIFDCFTFYNEIELLKIRLEILNPYVDKFVIVELNKTHRGIDKDLNFKKHINEFLKYMDKIIYIVPDKVPDYKGEGDWTIENFQRNSIMLGLKECQPDDIIMISDLDEIPNPQIFKDCSAVKYHLSDFKTLLCAGRKKAIIQKVNQIFKNDIKNDKNIKSGRFSWVDLLDKNRFVCDQECYYYYMNCRREEEWYGTTISKYKNMISPQNMRNNRFGMVHMEKSGWHFSYLGGVEKIKQKLASIIDDRSSVNEKMRKCLEDDEYIMYCMQNGINIFSNIDEPAEYHFIDINDIGIDNINKIEKEHPTLFYKN